MKSLSFLLAAALCTSSLVTASAGHDSMSLVSRHRRLGRSSPAILPRQESKRCRKRNPDNTGNNNSQSQNNGNNNASNNSNNNDGQNNAQNNWNPVSGIIQVAAGSCGDVGATAETTPTTGPNGGIDFLNCGVNAGGWSPPFIDIHSLVTKSLSEAIQSPSSPFHACSDFVWMFEQYGNEFGVPAIILASFAMQESSCNPSTTGGGGEAGLMQLTHDKCGDAPGGNCYDPQYNIRTGARFFSETLASVGGNVLEAIGRYNGWSPGMTFGSATAAASSPCCRCQNNLDYLHQFVNGWCQNINAYDNSLRLGKYFNLDVCH